MDGALVGSSTQPNTAGRTIDRMRYGLVAIAGGSQTNPLDLWFDRASVSRSPRGPLGTIVTPAPAPTNLAPSVKLDSPVQDSSFQRSLSMTASATDDHAVSYVQFLIDGRLQATDYSAPYSATVKTTGLSYGAHTVTARAYDAGGLTATSAGATVYRR